MNGNRDMGAGLNLAAYGVGAKLSHAPMRLLGFMATRAVDSDPRPRYWGGRDALAAALGKSPDNAGHKAVRDALQTLRKAGLIGGDGTDAHIGRQATYLLLDGAGGRLRPAPKEAHDERAPSESAGARSDDKRRTMSRQEAHGERAPEEEEDYKEEGARPPRSCRKHEGWDHDEPCRACMADRKAASAWETAQSALPQPARKHTHLAMEDGTCIGCELLLNSSNAWVERNDPSLAMDAA